MRHFHGIGLPGIDGEREGALRTLEFRTPARTMALARPDDRERAQRLILNAMAWAQDFGSCFSRENKSGDIVYRVHVPLHAPVPPWLADIATAIIPPLGQRAITSAR